MSSLLPISVADVKIDWVLGKMAESYKTTKQSVKEGLGTEASSSNNTKNTHERKQQRNRNLYRTAFVIFAKSLINYIGLL